MVIRCLKRLEAVGEQKKGSAGSADVRAPAYQGSGRPWPLGPSHVPGQRRAFPQRPVPPEFGFEVCRAEVSVLRPTGILKASLRLLG